MSWAYKRRQRYHYEIHLRGGIVIEGAKLWSGMLEAEREVSRRADELSREQGRAQRGFMIMRLSRRQKNRVEYCHLIG